MKLLRELLPGYKKHPVSISKIMESFTISCPGNDSNLLIVFYVQIMPDDFVMQLHRF
ncbi:pilus assembly protein [Escherichia coli]|nr:pilus assembly protein [Escherichia coli]PPY81873.1 pilus assembly protein [Escherichia coli]